MRTDWVEHDVMRLIMAALMPHNRLAVTVSLVTGMRISDVLDLKRSDLRRDRITYTEYKTLKRRTIRLPSKLRAELMAISGKIFVFEHRLDPLRPRTTPPRCHNAFDRRRRIAWLPETSYIK